MGDSFLDDMKYLCHIFSLDLNPKGREINPTANHITA